MRKLIILLSTSLIAIDLSSCDKAEYVNPALSVHGNWRLSGEGVDKNYNGRPDDELIAITNSSNYLILVDGGSGERRYPDSTKLLTWQVSDNVLTINQSGKQYSYVIRKIDAKELLLLEHGDSLSKWHGYARQ
jgi:hypothetical protein